MSALDFTTEDTENTERGGDGAADPRASGGSKADGASREALIGFPFFVSFVSFVVK